MAHPVTPARRELVFVGASLFVLHVYLFLRGLPFPDVDMTAYVEPAIVFAKEGIFRAPGSQHLNVVNNIGAFFYPPGYFWALALWVLVWGSGGASLLAFTHLVYLGFFLVVWRLMRTEFGCSRLASALAVLSLVGTLRHGRPDGVALLFSALTWLWVTRRPALSGAMLGVVGLCQPAYGLSTAVSAGAYLLLARRKDGVKPVLKIAGTAAGVFVGVFAGTLALQGAWSTGSEQFVLSMTVIGKYLNQWPPLFDKFGLAFVILPLCLLTLVPAIYFAIVPRSGDERRLSLSFLAGFFAWLLFNGKQLLTGLHFVYPARAFLHGSMANGRRFGWIAVVAYAGIHFYLTKGTWVYAFRSFEHPEVRFAGAAEPLAIDGSLFPKFYRPDSTVNYEIWKASNWWEKYQEFTSPRTLASLEKITPPEPREIWLTAWTVAIVGEPDPERYVRVSGEWPMERISFLGHPTQLPSEPLGLYRYLMKETVR